MTYSRRNSLATLAVLTVVLIGITFVPTTSAATTNNQGAPLVDATFGQLSNGVWYKVVSVSPSFPLQNASGTEIEYKLFSFNNHLYAIKVSNDWGLNVTGHIWYYRVVLISNPDGSTKPSGDETRVTTTAILINGSYSQKHDKTMTLYNVTSSNLPTNFRLGDSNISILKAAISTALAYETLIKNISAALYLGWGLSLITNDTTTVLQKSSFAYFNYAIAEDFFPYFNSTMKGVDADMMKVRHGLLGLIAYNDTNNNGVMDLGYRRVGDVSTGANYLGVTSSEARYVFKATSVRGVGSDWGAIPVYNSTTKAVDWSISLSGVNGTLIPVAPSISPIPTQIDQVKFAFHFIRPNNGSESGVKVDEHIGTFANVAGNSSFSKLSLAVAYYSYVENFQYSRYKLGMTTDSGSSLSPETNSTTSQAKVRLYGGGVESGFIKIGGDNYTWVFDGSTNKAYSNILPWFFFSEQFTLVGNYSVTGIGFNKYMYFYEACFPNWAGYGIIHDPYFATFSYSSTPSGGGLPIALVAAGVGIGALVAAAAILIRRRRSTVSAMPSNP